MKTRLWLSAQTEKVAKRARPVGVDIPQVVHGRSSRCQGHPHCGGTALAVLMRRCDMECIRGSSISGKLRQDIRTPRPCITQRGTVTSSPHEEAG